MKNKIKKAMQRKWKGDGHFIAVMLVIAAVCVMGVFYGGKAKSWISTKWNTMDTNTANVFDNLSTGGGSNTNGGTSADTGTTGGN